MYISEYMHLGAAALTWRAGRYDHIDDIAAGRPVGQLSDAQVTLYKIVPTHNQN